MWIGSRSMRIERRLIVGSLGIGMRVIDRSIGEGMKISR
jgi:hypothetical protein